jgi:hypothetical protein
MLNREIIDGLTMTRNVLGFFAAVGFVICIVMPPLVYGLCKGIPFIFGGWWSYWLSGL